MRTDETKCQLGSSFGDDFQVESDSVFGVDFRVNWDCASAVKAI